MSTGAVEDLEKDVEELKVAAAMFDHRLNLHADMIAHLTENQKLLGEILKEIRDRLVADLKKEE